MCDDSHKQSNEKLKIVKDDNRNILLNRTESAQQWSYTRDGIAPCGRHTCELVVFDNICSYSVHKHDTARHGMG